MLFERGRGCLPAEALVQQQLALAMTITFWLVIEGGTVREADVRKMMYAHRASLESQRTAAVNAAQQMIIGERAQRIEWHIVNGNALIGIGAEGNQRGLAHRKRGNVTLAGCHGHNEVYQNKPTISTRR